MRHGLNANASRTSLRDHAGLGPEPPHPVRKERLARRALLALVALWWFGVAAPKLAWPAPLRVAGHALEPCWAWAVGLLEACVAGGIIYRKTRRMFIGMGVAPLLAFLLHSMFLSDPLHSCGCLGARIVLRREILRVAMSIAMLLHGILLFLTCRGHVGAMSNESTTGTLS